MEYHWGCFACLWPNWSGQAGRIYRGQVSRLLNYGAVISFETSEGKHEGWLHPSDLPTSRNGQCFVMIVGHSGTMHKLAVHLDQESVKSSPSTPTSTRPSSNATFTPSPRDSVEESSDEQPTPPLSPQPQGGDCAVVKPYELAPERLERMKLFKGLLHTLVARQPQVSAASEASASLLKAPRPLLGPILAHDVGDESPFVSEDVPAVMKTAPQGKSPLLSKVWPPSDVVSYVEDVLKEPDMEQENPPFYAAAQTLSKEEIALAWQAKERRGGCFRWLLPAFPKPDRFLPGYSSCAVAKWYDELTEIAGLMQQSPAAADDATVPRVESRD